MYASCSALIGLRKLLHAHLRLCFPHADGGLSAPLSEATAAMVLYAPAVHLTQHTVWMMDGNVWTLYTQRTVSPGPLHPRLQST